MAQGRVPVRENSFLGGAVKVLVEPKSSQTMASVVEGKSTIELDVYHTGLELNMPQLKFQANQTIGKLKQNLSRRTGTEPRHMR